MQAKGLKPVNQLMWSRQRIAKLNMNQDEFTKAFVAALQNERVMEQLRKTICSDLQKQMSELKDLIAEKDNKIKDLEKKVDALENRNDDLEQYTRRNSLRLHGVEEKENEDILQTALDLFATEIDTDIRPAAIDRVHRIGKKTSDRKPRPVIVKFTNYIDRKRVFEAKSRLRNNSSQRIFVNEDLTQKRSHLLYQARQLRKNHRIMGCWTIDGRVLIKTLNGKVVNVSNIFDLNEVAV